MKYLILILSVTLIAFTAIMCKKADNESLLYNNKVENPLSYRTEICCDSTIAEEDAPFPTSPCVECNEFQPFDTVI
jgi:hypothetical protein